AALIVVRETLFEAAPAPMSAESVPPWAARNGMLGYALTRRLMVAALGAAAGGYALTFIGSAFGPRQRFTSVRVLDPQEPIPSGGLDAPNPHPNLLGTPEMDGAPGPRPDPSSSEPPAPRQLARDKDGALLPSGRRPGELAELITPNDNFY